MKASTAVDSNFVNAVYGTFEEFLNYQLNKKYDKYRFVVKLSGTIFDEEERLNNAIRLAECGIITPELPAALHLNEKEFRDGTSLMNSLGYPDRFKPIQTAHTMSNNQKEDAGRKELDIDKKTEKGEETADLKTNEDR
jgi:hypothetical protein